MQKSNETRMVVSRYAAFKNRAFVIAKNKMPEFVTLSVTADELVTFINCSKDML
jgi:hypothetical protein